MPKETSIILTDENLTCNFSEELGGTAEFMFLRWVVLRGRERARGARAATDSGVIPKIETPVLWQDALPSGWTMPGTM